jgi:CheY-like chemotaxis protein
MHKDRQKVTILIVDDDPEDCLIMRTAFEESSLEHDLTCFADGQQLMDYLHRCCRDASTPYPDLILLDLNMPVKDGRAVLYEIKSDSDLKGIPIVVLTDSEDPLDAIQCYELGASLFYTKFQWLEMLGEIIKDSGEYWFDFAAKFSGMQEVPTGPRERKGKSWYPPPQLSRDEYTQIYP